MTNPGKEQETNASVVEIQATRQVFAGQFDKPLQGRQPEVRNELFGTGPTAADGPEVGVQRVALHGVVQAARGGAHGVGYLLQALAQFT